MGQVLAGRYTLEEPIATGGMGTVWRARDEVLHRSVAVKLLHDGLADDEKAAARFRREALTAAQIHHPNMANVFDYVEDDGRPGIVMELVDSETLAQRLARDHHLGPAEAARITVAVLAALETAHRAGVVHRDVKPGNILLCADGGVKVTDFGIARSLGDASLTATGTVMGTPHYSAPEQVRGEAATPSTDIYAAGVVLFEMLTGERPFEADTPVAVAMARLSDDPPPVRSLRPDVPPAVEAVVTRALARDPAGRFSSAAEMAGALAESGDGVMRDATLVMPVADGSVDTVQMARAPHAIGEPKTPPGAMIEEIAPPRWAWTKIARVLLPLIAVAAIAAVALRLVEGPSLVSVPSVTGRPFAEAQQSLVTLGLQVRRVGIDSDRARNTVIAQTPESGSLEPGATVTLRVSDGTCCRVPNVIGKSLDRARELLADAKLDVGTIFRQPSNRPEGEVVAANPGVGSEVTSGRNVDLYVSGGEEKDDDKGNGGKGKGNGKGNGDD